MVPPLTVLRKHHSLKGTNMLDLVRRLRRNTDQLPPTLARVVSGKPLEDYSLADLKTQFLDLSGETLGGVLELCDREVNILNGRLLMHHAIILANEIGQPRGQDLHAATPLNQEAEPTQPPLKKARPGDASDLLTRVKQLEASMDKDDVVQIRDKVRALCLQSSPSEPLILLTVDELARAARRVSHEEADTYEELSRQLVRQQGRLNIASLCLSVIGGRATDTITKALNKCLKEKQIEEKIKDENRRKVDTAEKGPVSPLANLYPPPYFPTYPGPAYPMYGAQPGWATRFPRAPQKSFPRPNKGACHFCESTDHFIRDCPKMKEAKKKSM